MRNPRNYQWEEQIAPAPSKDAEILRELRLARQAGQVSLGYQVSNKGASKPKGLGPMARVLTKLAVAGVAVAAATTAVAITTDVDTGAFTSEVVAQVTEFTENVFGPK
ncbi:hypothetical protein [Sulfitobacter sp. R18_1]|uniref:hypothetical protein n=1 Tax=Sulfitobacter sp. R18_1 TaxID=2821104 RepID=UPI001ADB8571|nr:hypothetical protein [Sulfitobacter sp. R18_1]MBO9427988.1 hypothetical protein [Sulfitobacter sp. R18_1]